MVMRVLVSLIMIVVASGIGLGLVHSFYNRDQPDGYQGILNEYGSYITKENENTLRKLAYEVQVTEKELIEIRNNMAELDAYKYTCYENMRLAHFYSVILNRYGPNATYQETIILIEYVFDGVLERKYLADISRINDDASLLTEGVFLTMLGNIEREQKLSMDKLVQEVFNDFMKYTTPSVKVSVYSWLQEGLPHIIHDEKFMAWQKFRVLMTQELTQIDMKVV